MRTLIVLAVVVGFVLCANVPQKRATPTDGPSQNVRDPVREKAQQNYVAVINELNNKFANLREGCFPRPKGCLCVIGKDNNGHEITRRIVKENDCRCPPGQPTCPLPAAA